MITSVAPLLTDFDVPQLLRFSPRWVKGKFKKEIFRFKGEEGPASGSYWNFLAWQIVLQLVFQFHSSSVDGT